MIYLDNSATSNKKPKRVIRAMNHTLKNSINIGRTINKKAFLYSKKIYDTRVGICDFIGGNEPENIIFTVNATYALNLALKGAVKSKNPHIITTYSEHNSVLRQIYTHNIDVSFLPCNKDYTVDISKIPGLIKDNTDLIVLNCGSNVTGNILDWKLAYDLTKEYKIPILFDFSQVVGNYNIDLYGMENCYAAFSGHKSLLGPQGTGVLYIASSSKLNTIIEGGTGSMSNELTQPEFLPDRFECGTLNVPGILGLNEGVKYIKKESVEKLRTKKMELCQFMYDKLKNMNKIKLYHNGIFENKIPIISFNIGNVYSDEIATELTEKYRISVRGGFHCAPFIHKVMGTEEQGAVRVSVGYKNTKREINKFIDAIYKISKNIL